MNKMSQETEYRENSILSDFDPKDIQKRFSLFRKKWTIIVFMEFNNGKIITFQNLQKKLAISPSNLSLTLKTLQNECLISRNVFGGVSPLRIEYRITSNGEKLMIVLFQLINWIYESKSQTK